MLTNTLSKESNSFKQNIYLDLNWYFFERRNYVHLKNNTIYNHLN